VTGDPEETVERCQPWASVRRRAAATGDALCIGWTAAPRYFATAGGKRGHSRGSCSFLATGGAGLLLGLPLRTRRPSHLRGGACRRPAASRGGPARCRSCTASRLLAQAGVGRSRQSGSRRRRDPSRRRSIRRPSASHPGLACCRSLCHAGSACGGVRPRCRARSPCPPVPGGDRARRPTGTPRSSRPYPVGPQPRGRGRRPSRLCAPRGRRAAGSRIAARTRGSRRRRRQAATRTRRRPRRRGPSAAGGRGVRSRP
jgi:hypothetical protein